ncbi:MAG: hypothetical protein OEY63_04725, partial [Gemmatimonadota bacterium]|nr:hypothetical protein [Gemmatimonadota bacterium]
MKRLAYSLVIGSIAFGLGCDGDPFGTPDTGSLSIQVVYDSSALLKAAPETGAVELDGPGMIGIETEGESGQAVQEFTGPSSSVIYLPGSTANATFDGVKVSVSGLTNKTVNLTLVGGSWEGTVDSLQPGTYSVSVEGLVGGEVDYFGSTTGVNVVAGENTAATISNFASFVPVMSAFSSPTTIFAPTASFSGVAAAQSYDVEWDTDVAFSNPQSATVTGTSHNLSVSDTGTVYVRVRSVANTSTTGRFSAPEAFTVSTDLDSSGTQVTPFHLGFGNASDTTLTRLNVFPDLDEDWFSVRACQADTLVAQVRTVSATPGSNLTAMVRVWDSTGVAIDSSFGSDPQAISLLPADGRYDIQVTNTGGTFGHYELVTDLQPGSFNSGTNCITPTTMSYNVQPTTAVAGAAISPAVEIRVLDPQGAVATSFTGDITVAITTATGTGGAALGGTLTQAAVAGVATFADLSIDSAGTGYTLTSTSLGIVNGTSTTFDILAGPAATLEFSVEPTNAAAGVAISPTVFVTAKDAIG